MSLLDVRTVMISQALTDAVCTAVLVFLWMQNRKRFQGTHYWVLDFAFQTAATLLIVARGSIPAWASMGVSNTLVVAGALLGYLGLTRFVEKRTFQIHNFILLGAFLVIHLYFILVQPNLAARTLNVSLALLIICLQCVVFVLSRVPRAMRRLTLGVGLVFSGFCLVSMIRIVVQIVSPSTDNDFFRSGAYDTILLMTYQMLLVLLTFAISVMFNQRLLQEVAAQEEIFATAFRSSPYGITLTRPSDGQIRDVNEGFQAITGYTHAETVGKTTIDLRLWVDEKDRIAVVSELSRGFRILGREYQFRTKSGERVTGLFSAEIITINGQPFILSSISDVTERKDAQDKIERQLEELRRWQEVMLGREDRVRQLKREINELSSRLGEPVIYRSEEPRT
jgi:PAS domain S-box-containing protein